MTQATTTAETSHRPHEPLAGLALGPAAAAALVASAIVATTFALGAAWLGTPILGLPLGLYVIVAATLAAALATRRFNMDRGSRIAPGTRDDSMIEPPIAAGGSLVSGTMEVASFAAYVVSGVARRLASEASVNEIEDRVARSLSQWPARALRIGVQGPRSLGSSMAAAIDPSLATWLSIAPGLDADAAMRRRGLDAVVIASDDRIVVRTPMRGDRPGAWHNWCQPRPISFLSAFPGRIDTEELAFSDAVRDDAAQVLGSLVALAAATARDAMRTDLSDRLRGRAFMPRLAHEALDALVRQARRYGPTFSGDELSRATARVLSAASACESFRLSDATRRSIAELASGLAGDEPEVMLRVGAARMSDLDDDAALDALLRAERMLRDARVLPGVDHSAFVLAEIGAGAHGPLGIGRIAAALTLSLSQMRVDDIAFTATDVIDDLRHCEWLIGRDQDCAMLLSLCRTIEKTRRGEVYALPQRLAA